MTMNLSSILNLVEFTLIGLITGSQWDGFRHWGLPDSQLFWNGQHQSEIIGDNINYRNSLHVWAERGIVGRGVLLDYRYGTSRIYVDLVSGL
jgi:hypothetical protein